MSLFSILILAIGLSMDAFAASICQGLQIKETTIVLVFVLEFFKE